MSAADPAGKADGGTIRKGAVAVSQPNLEMIRIVQNQVGLAVIIDVTGVKQSRTQGIPQSGCGSGERIVRLA